MTAILKDLKTAILNENRHGSPTRASYGYLLWARNLSEVCYFHGCAVCNIVVYCTAFYRESIVPLYMYVYIYTHTYIYICIYVSWRAMGVFCGLETWPTFAIFINVVLCEILYCTASYRESVVLLHVCASIRMTYGCFSWYRKPAEVCYHHSYCIVRHNIVLYRTTIYHESLILLYICAPTWIYACICISMHLYVCIRVCARTYMLHEVRILFRTGNSVHIIWKVPNVCISCIAASLFLILFIFLYLSRVVVVVVLLLLLLLIIIILLLLFLSRFCFPVWLSNFTFKV